MRSAGRVHEVLLEPAAMNPVSAELLRAIEQSGLSYHEIARRMGTGHAVISRMVNPFYWGHSLPTVRRLARGAGDESQNEAVHRLTQMQNVPPPSSRSEGGSEM